MDGGGHLDAMSEEALIKNIAESEDGLMHMKVVLERGGAHEFAGRLSEKANRTQLRIQTYFLVGQSIAEKEGEIQSLCDAHYQVAMKRQSVLGY